MQLGIDTTIAAALIGAAGGFVIWLLNLLSTLYAERRTAKRIRTMLMIEVEDNLRALRNFRGAAEGSVQFSQAKHLGRMEYRDAITRNTLPKAERRVWEILTSSLPLALTAEEIHGLHQFHSRLNQLSGLHSLAQHGTERREAFITDLDSILGDGNPITSRDLTWLRRRFSEILRLCQSIIRAIQARGIEFWQSVFRRGGG
jgi:hypothetical protein